MQLTPIIIGGLIGVFLASGSHVFLGFAAGAALGYLLGQLHSLQDKMVGALPKRANLRCGMGYFFDSVTYFSMTADMPLTE